MWASLHARAPQLALVAAVQHLDPESWVVIHSGAAPAGPRWLAKVEAEGRRADEPIENEHLLPRTCLYDARRADRFTNRPVALGALVRSPLGARALELLEQVIEPNGALHQLRMVVHVDGSVGLFVGLYRGPHAKAFGAREHALLFALQPVLAEWARLARAVGRPPLGDGAIVDTLDALDRPALLLRSERVVHANSQGALLATTVERWARGRPRAEGIATAVPLAPSGVELELVLPRVSLARELEIDATLPAALRPVARALADGLSDKEIAARLDMPLATARTYVSRALEKLGARDRRELIRRWGSAG